MIFKRKISLFQTSLCQDDCQIYIFDLLSSILILFTDVSSLFMHSLVDCCICPGLESNP